MNNKYDWLNVPDNVSWISTDASTVTVVVMYLKRIHTMKQNTFVTLVKHNIVQLLKKDD